MTDVPPGPYFTPWELAGHIVERRRGSLVLSDGPSGTTETIVDVDGPDRGVLLLGALAKIVEAARDGQITIIGRPVHGHIDSAEHVVVPISHLVMSGIDPIGDGDSVVLEPQGKAAFAAGGVTKYLDLHIPQRQALTVWPIPQGRLPPESSRATAIEVTPPDPFAEPDWNLAQVTAWAYFRDADAVGRASNAYAGQRLWSRLDLTIEDQWRQASDADHPPPCFATLDEALRDIVLKGREGLLPGMAYKDGAGERVRLPTDAWIGVRIADEPSGHLVLAPTGERGSTWTNVMIERDSIVAAWPARPTDSEATTMPWLPEGYVSLLSVIQGLNDAAGLNRLRNALHLGQRPSWLKLPSGDLVPIRKPAWASPAADDVLVSGMATTEFALGTIPVPSYGFTKRPEAIPVLLRADETNGRETPAPGLAQEPIVERNPSAPRKSARGKKRGLWFSHLPNFLALRLEADPGYFESPPKTIRAEVKRYFDKENPGGKKWGRVPTSRSALDEAIKAAEPRARALAESRSTNRPAG